VLVLATTGLLRVIAYSVSRHTREIGVRAALGADASDIRLMIVRQGLRTILPGVAIGIARRSR
jgi:putative ABC transport system permease protein